MSETSNVRYRITCPHLGMLQDKSTAFSYPTEGNYCFKCKVPTSPPLSHQDEYCLTLKRNECPAFSQDRSNPFPQEIINKDKGTEESPSKKKRFLWISLGLLATVMVSYAVSMYLHNGQIELPYLNIRAKQNNTPLAVETGGEHMIPVTGSIQTATVIPTSQTPTPVNESALITQTDRPTHVKTTAKPSLANVLTGTNITSVASGATTSSTVQKTATATRTTTSTQTKTNTPKPTNTKSPTITQTLPANPRDIETPIRVDNREFIIHMIASGENYDVLARKYDTKVDVLLAINYEAPSPLWVKSTIVISPGLQVDDPTIPALQAELVTDAVIDIETLAKKFKVDPVLMKKYNNCSQNCSLAAGDWVLVPHTR